MNGHPAVDGWNSYGSDDTDGHHDDDTASYRQRPTTRWNVWTLVLNHCSGVRNAS